ncbi:uncharacterized protein PV07_09071 [Cladophialophora immunda]|uniref:Transcriptional activator HAP2 n=1 Tax=Cladophialophora immunda TaxID=569365 RepID=A0A0D2ALL6_9EURO|nr:uncharacterized protein PV07_09071 [Cladophialophora immunda]KIW25937.1 hypothetical protein PV07_09071 [Cladophialophora immunda]OQU98129.1 hypothetical protein CLAIMM_03954 [Cladophialophora immunda]
MGFVCTNPNCRHRPEDADCYGCDLTGWRCCKCHHILRTEFQPRAASPRASSPASSIGSVDSGTSVPPGSKKRWPKNVFASWKQQANGKISTEIQSVQAQEEIAAGGAEKSPVYVNAKQFHRILKRRVARRKLEEQLRLSSKGRNGLHEFGRNHPMRRPRGPGGRFLTADELAALGIDFVAGGAVQ